MNPSGQLRQKLLILYLDNSDLSSSVVGWSLYDGTGKYEYEAAGDPDPPYHSVLDAMRDGWRVIQIPPLQASAPGRDYETDYLRYEFVLEKMETVDE